MNRVSIVGVLSIALMTWGRDATKRREPAKVA
jgi:hypothetical protein